MKGKAKLRAGTGVYIDIHEDSDNEVAVEANVRSTLRQNQHRATRPFIRAVDLCRYV